MRLKARSKGKHNDVRDECWSLNLTAQGPEDVAFLTRIYRHLAGIETDAPTSAAIEVLCRPTERFTNPRAEVIMNAREGLSTMLIDG